MALEGLTLNGLSLNNGTTHMLTALQLPIPAKKPEWVEGADADGAILMRDPLVENGTLIATVDLIGSTKAQALSLIGAIVDELEEADRNPAGIPVVWTPAGGGLSMTFYALSGEVTQLENDIKFTAGNVPTVVVTLKCRPGGYGPLVTGPSQTTAGPVVQLTVPDVPGDMPTDEAYIVITDQSSQARRHVEWGAEWLHYNPATSLVLDSDSLVTSGFSGTSQTFVGAYDPNATGSNVIGSSALASVTALAGTGTQTHVGTFRVRARVYVDRPGIPLGDCYFRLAWRAGDGSYISNDWAMPPAANTDLYWSEIDLGLISVPPAPVGAQSWDGRLEVHTTQAASGSLDVLVDYLILVPVSAGYGRARTVGIARIAATTAFDDFGQATGSVTGDTMNLGGTWTTAGSDADDFTTTTGIAYATRSAVSDANSLARFATAATSYTDVYVGCDVQLVGTVTTPMTGTQMEGVVARWVDQNNWCGAARVASFATTGWLALVITTGGVMSLIYGSLTTEPAISAAGTWWTIGLSVTAAGEYTVYLNGTGRFNGTNPTLATGGTLASGKCGIYDSSVAADALERRFTNFQASQIVVPSPVIYSGRTFEVTSDAARRQDSTGTVYGLPESYRGSRFVLNPEGSAGRTTRIAAKAHRSDVETGPATIITDQLKAQVFYRPRYSVVPR